MMLTMNIHEKLIYTATLTILMAIALMWLLTPYLHDAIHNLAGAGIRTVLRVASPFSRKAANHSYRYRHIGGHRR